jgi:hypothetical protein
MADIAIRQIKDIQSQIKNVDPFSKNGQIPSLFTYSTEIKNHLLKHTKDDLIRKHLSEIPDFKMEDFKLRRNYFWLVIAFLAFYESFNNNKYDYQAAKDALNSIGDKYASIELLILNSPTSL